MHLTGKIPTTHTHRYRNGTPFSTKNKKIMQTNVIGVATHAQVIRRDLDYLKIK